jgi:class 3 adenylate cyclase
MNCPQCQTGNPEGARTCQNCGAALVQHCAGCQGVLPGGARFCPHCGQPVLASTPADDARLSRLAAAAPAGLVEKVRAAEHLAGERRPVTVLFADVVGSRALAEQVGAETWTEMVNSALDRVTPAIYRYEGTIARLVGDGLWAFFGAPVAHEDDPVRAVRAALDLLEAARDYAREVRERHGVEFAVRACLHTGQVVTGSVGDDLRYEYQAAGGAVNLASRLKFAAQPMTVLVSQSTHRFIEPVFDCTDLGPLQGSSREEPLRVYRVQGPRIRPGPTRGLAPAGLESPMVGRDRELETLTQLCGAVQAGLGRVVLVVGEPGLGKTRLIAEWKAAAKALGYKPAPLWAEGRCLSYGQGWAYHLLVHLLRSVLGVTESADEPETRAALLTLSQDLFGESWRECYPYLAHLLMLKLEDAAQARVQMLDPQALQARYLEALRRLLVALTGRQPVMLVFEDLHWADPSSVELLTKLLPLVAAAPLLVCLVSRPDRDAPGWKLVTSAREVLGGSLTEITLDSLSERHSRQLVANLLEIEALSEGVRALILQRAEGNPFFVEEVIRMLIDRGAVVQVDGGWHAGAEIESLEIPDNLQGLLLARIDRLPDDVKLTLRVASVIGRQFPVRVLAQVLEES